MRLSSCVLILGGLFFANPAWSQGEGCNPDETIVDCVDRVVFRAIPELRKSTPAAGKSSTAAANTEAAVKNQAGAAASTGQANSTFTDLLPWFNMLGLLSDDDASDGTIALDLNFLLLRNRKDLVSHDSQLQWAFNLKPQPFEPLIAALPEDVQADRKKALQEKIDDTADSELQYTMSVVTDGLGRDFRRHFNQLANLIAPIVAEAGAPGDNQLRGEAQARFGAGLQKLHEDLVKMRPGDADGAVAARTMAEFRSDEKKLVDDFVKAQRADVAVAIAKHLDAVGAAIKNPNIKALANLVLLQPQLTFSLNRQIRNELVGPEAWGAKVTFERSFVDFNRFLKDPGDECSGIRNSSSVTPLSLDAAKSCLKKVGDYVAANAEDLENESRWKASLEYKQVDSWQYALPDDGVAMDRPKYDRVVASAGFGRAVPRSAAKDRVDFEASYDSNIDSDDNYKSRLVATLTYTRRFGDMDIPFSIVYANKSEFLEGVDKQIGLHVGVKFRGVEKGK